MANRYSAWSCSAARQVFIRKRWKRPTPRRRLSERVLTSWTWCVTFTVCQSFEEVTKVSWRNYFPLLRYQIATHRDLSQIFQVNEELSRIRSAIGSSSDRGGVSGCCCDQALHQGAGATGADLHPGQRGGSLARGGSCAGLHSSGPGLSQDCQGAGGPGDADRQRAWDSLTQQADSVYRLGLTQ